MLRTARKRRYLHDIIVMRIYNNCIIILNYDVMLQAKSSTVVMMDDARFRGQCKINLHNS